MLQERIFGLLAVAGLSQIQLVINSPRPKQRRIQDFDSVRRHHEQNIRRCVETIQHIQQPGKSDTVPVSNVLLLVSRLSTVVPDAWTRRRTGFAALHAIDVLKQQHRIRRHPVDCFHQTPVVEVG
jgi:hypothetical protein